MIRPLLTCAVVAGLGLGSVGCQAPGKPNSETIWPQSRFGVDPPPAPREFRAAWVATVSNIDWPSKPGLDAATQQKEIDAILDQAVRLKLNALIVQVRTTCDALYDSQFEPWSAYLTGKQGQNPGYDPLDYWVRAGHERGIEIHAWFNPYRAKHKDSKVELADSHVAKRRPDLTVKYGSYIWLDPGQPEAEQQSFDVFMDVVKRYDVDGIHIDDYFYPYPEPVNPKDKNDKRELPFPDDASWNKHLAEIGRAPESRATSSPVSVTVTTATAERADWRRSNINHFIQRIYEGKQQLKPWVKFGISPFGIGRPGTAPGIKGFDQYDKLYADAALWLTNGWCDYFTPQLYWPIAKKEQSYPVLLDYWISVNPQHRHIWPGLFTSRVIETGKTKYPVNEVTDQIAVTRDRPAGTGHVHYSFKALQRSEKLAHSLETSSYPDEALVPATQWLDPSPPAAPAIHFDSATRTLSLAPGVGEPIRGYAVWQRDRKTGWQFRVDPVNQQSLWIGPTIESVVVTAVDRVGNESERVRVETK